jgi:hypothetical protein
MYVYEDDIRCLRLDPRDARDSSAVSDATLVSGVMSGSRCPNLLNRACVHRTMCITVSIYTISRSLCIYDARIHMQML